MASHRAAATLLLVASLLMAVACLSGSDARPTVRADETRLTERRDANGTGYVATDATSAVTEPECYDGEVEPQPTQRGSPPPPGWLPAESPYSQTDPGTGLDSEESEVDQELCSTCEKQPKNPKPPCDNCEPDPKPPCDNCEPDPEQEPELTCKKVHAVREGETCDSVGKCAGLGEDDFLRFNPNICCEKLFVGQWVCLDATCDD